MVKNSKRPDWFGLRFFCKIIAQFYVPSDKTNRSLLLDFFSLEEQVKIGGLIFLPIYDGHYSASFEQQNDQYLSKTSRLESIQNLNVRFSIKCLNISTALATDKK